MIPRREAVVRVDGDDIAYDVCGEGDQVVVLLHGSGGSRATWWPVVPLLARDRTVVLPDVRGHGHSTDTAHSLGVAAVVDDLEAIRADVGAARWAVAGHSLGGYFALGYAAAAPDRCLGAASVSSLGGVLTDEAAAHLTRFRELAASWQRLDAADSTTSLSDAFCAAHPEQAYLYQAMRALNPPLAMDTPAVRMEGMMLAPGRPAGVPTLFVTGTEDALAPPDVVRSCAAALPGSSYVELDGAGHVCFWEQPGEFADALTAWLADLA